MKEIPSYRLNYSKKQSKNFINIGNHPYSIYCTNGKIRIPMGKQTIRACNDSISLNDKILSKEEFNTMFPPMTGKKYIASKWCAKIAYHYYDRRDIIFADFTEENFGDWGWLYTF